MFKYKPNWSPERSCHVGIVPGENPFSKKKLPAVHSGTARQSNHRRDQATPSADQARLPFQRLKPMGWETVRLEDFLPA